jgi:hypothetical protein
VRLFLEREQKGGGVEFALADVLNDPEWVYQDEELEGEEDTEDPRPYNYDYGDGEYLKRYQEEREARSPNLETIGVNKHICAMKCGKEIDVFAN